MKMRDKNWTWLALAIMVVGGLLRLAPLFATGLDVPFHLGGLFYEFSRQIVDNNFALPVTIPYYSAGGIPFAYPPLGFYIQALLLKLFDPPLFVTVNLIPPLVTLSTLPAFYWMMYQYSDDRALRLAALFAFAVIPEAYSNQIEAAGLAEAFGLLTLLLYLGWLFRFERDPGPGRAALAGLFLGLCVLSSPGSAYAAALLSLLFFFKVLISGIKSRAFAPAGWLLLTAMVGLLVSAPYWLTVVSRFGPGIYFSSFAAEHDQRLLLRLQALAGFAVSTDVFGFVWGWLVFAGVLWAGLNRRWFVLLMLLLFWLIPREGPWLVTIPASILAGMGIIYVLWPLVYKTLPPDWKTHPPFAPGLLVVLLAALVLVNAVLADSEALANSDWQITSSQVATLMSLRSDLPSDANLLVVGNGALQEWAPSLLQRQVLNTTFGLEWQPEELKKVIDINNALDQSDLVTALVDAQEYSGRKQFYLLSPPETLAALLAEATSPISIKPIVSEPELSLSLVEISK